MTFSYKVKRELAESMPNARHCRLAELAALVMMAGDTSGGSLRLRSENALTAERFAELVRKLFSTELNVQDGELKRAGKTVYEAEAGPASGRIFEALKANSRLIPGGVLYQQPCCRRAFLRGAFLAAGSVSDPQKDYHLEIVAQDEERADIIARLFLNFNIDAKVIVRKNTFVVYLKDGESIVDVLNIIEAHVSLMEFENIRILKDMRNSVNRRVNCEAANIGKTIEASARQIEDINFIRERMGFEHLSEELRTTALLRLEHPDSSLTELGKLHERPIGRSGVNHRLQKLSDIADRLRNGQP